MRKQKSDVTCWSCEGHGKTKEGYGYHNDYSWERCRRCDGKGKIPADVVEVMNRLATLYNKNSSAVERVNKKFDKRIGELKNKKSAMVETLTKKLRAQAKAIKAAHPDMHLPFWD
jgi:hypothetical protein